MVQQTSLARLALFLLGLSLPASAQVDLGLALTFPQAKNPTVVEEKSSVGLQVGAQFLNSDIFQGRTHVGWIGLNSQSFEAKVDRSYIESNIFFAGIDVNRWVVGRIMGLLGGMEVRYSHRSMMSAPQKDRRRGTLIASERVLDLAPSLGVRFMLSSGSNPLYLEARYLHPLILNRFDHNGLDPPRPELRFSIFLLL